jgi:hypothetical protein
VSDERKHPNQAKNALDASSSSAEHADVQCFCANVRYEEISFDSWRAGHSSLDLRYPLNIKKTCLSQSSTRLVKLSRTIRTTANGRRREMRERFECLVPLREDLKDQSVLKYPGLGDRCDEEVGDLLIILRISD